MYTFVKWFAFIIVCLDLVGYILEFGDKNSRPRRGISTFIGMIIGIIARVFVLYGAATCWLLK